MKKILAVIGSLIILVVIFSVGYFSGNKLGQTTGAQQYTQKLFSVNEISISTSGMLDQINIFRKANGKNILEESIGICNIAQKRAEIYFKKKIGDWDSANGNYKNTDTNDVGISLDEAKKMCPECVFIKDKELFDNYYGELSFIVLHPDMCITVNQKINLPCKGDESFSLTEHFPERILKQWTEDESFKKMLLLDNYNIGCVRSFGGSIIFATAVKN